MSKLQQNKGKLGGDGQSPVDSRKYAKGTTSSYACTVEHCIGNHEQRNCRALVIAI